MEPSTRARNSASKHARVLFRTLKRQFPPLTELLEATLSPEHLKALRAFGYLGGKKPDEKDR